MANPKTFLLRFFSGLDALDCIIITGPAALREAIRRIERKKTVVFFPEGKRSDEGRISTGEAGIAYAAIKTRTDILPVKITGTDKALDYRKWVVRPGAKIGITIGKPISLDDYHTGPITATAREAMGFIMESIEGLD